MLGGQTTMPPKTFDRVHDFITYEGRAMKRGLHIDVTIPEEFNLTSYILEDNVVQGRGNKTALCCEDEKYTFSELCELTNKFGNVLQELGVQFQERVLLILQDSPEWVAAWFATMKIGAVAAHAYTYLKSSDYDYLINYVQPRMVVVDKTTLEVVRNSVRQAAFDTGILVAGNDLPVLGDREYALNPLLEKAEPRLVAYPTHRSDLAFWNFSGGTTGKPKGVPHNHASLVYGSVSTQQNFRYTPDDVVLRVPKLFFHYARDNGMNWPMRQGATVILSPQKATRELVFQLIEKFKPTVLINVPTMMRAMIESPLAKSADLSGIRLSLASGEPLSAQLWNDFHAAFGLEVRNTLGSAETNIAHAIDRPGQIRPGSNGMIVPLVDFKIVDENGEEVPKGETGVLWVRSGASGSYYYMEPEKSRITFPGDGWVNTSDLFREDEDGYYWCMGRGDLMIKVSGVYVSPLEVENCLERYPAVAECAVLGIKNEDGLAHAKAFVVLRDGFEPSELTAQDLWNFCRMNLAPYKVPKVLELLQHPLPKTGQGKIDRQRLLANEEKAECAFSAAMACAVTAR
jgi:benzoate-CoA ligase family protein